MLTCRTGTSGTTALFSIRLHFVRKERIGVAKNQRGSILNNAFASWVRPNERREIQGSQLADHQSLAPHIAAPVRTPPYCPGTGLGGREEEREVPVAERDGFAPARDGPRWLLSTDSR